jgi:hypothetical protein
MNERARAELARLEDALLAARPRRMFDSKVWAADMPAEPGVYALWDMKSLNVFYVGETSSLRHRMCDIGRSVNHTCRRKIAKLLELPFNDEVALSRAMAERYVVSFIEVQLGRAELEEYLVLRWRDTIVNKPAKRLLRGSRYKWVTPANPRFEWTPNGVPQA